MTKRILQFQDSESLGVVSAVDTTRVVITVSNHDALTSVGVNELVALRGASQNEVLIGIVERVTRQVRDLLSESDDEDEFEVTDRKEDLIRAALIGTFRHRHGKLSNTFKRGADSMPQIDSPCFLLTGKHLKDFMGLLGQELDPNERLVLGKYVSDQSVETIANGDRFFQRHASILGSTGSGKSWSVALLLERASKLEGGNIVVLDMHGEYASLTNGKNAIAEYLRVAGPGDLKSPGDDVLFLPFWLMNREEALATLLDRSDANAPNQASRFTSIVRELKGDTVTSVHPEATYTVDSPIPFRIEELLERLRSDDVQMIPGSGNREKMGPFNSKLTRFIARLESKCEDRRYGFMFQPPEESYQYDWMHAFATKLVSNTGRGIKVIDFSAVPSDVLPVVAGLLARTLFEVQVWMSDEARVPISIVCDEAHNYLPTRESTDVVSARALSVFESIAKEGRKYGVGLVVVSQRPSDVSRTILSQCSNFLILRLTNDQDQNTVARLVPDSLGGIVEMLPLLDVGEAILLGDSVLLPVRIKLDRPDVQPTSATRDFWSDWRTQSSDGSAIVAAVESLRSQTHFE